MSLKHKPNAKSVLDAYAEELDAEKVKFVFGFGAGFELLVALNSPVDCLLERCSSAPHL